ncbi:MAG TPA: valine--tRNA ligase [Gammaproteobacteria bacterium]|nr:valine--tRNA ligase [Gammaproteobacteria bacterium]
MPEKTILSKSYEPQTIETRLYTHWENNGWFQPQGEGQPYCIMIPPPNVTGRLHMGHAFQDTLMDTLIRYHRMRGDNTLWQPGTDHAGIATQMLVERKLESQGENRHDLGRERFIEKVWEWKAKSGGAITQQLRRMGCSVDWQRERFTMDEGLSAAVREVFVQLYEQNLIYRGKRLVNWDPVLLTAVSDLEVISEEEQGHLWHLRYPLVDQSGYLVVATTRPETLFGDSAVVVHPEDERYRHLIGKKVRLPLTHRQIPIIADEHADPEFGSGCVKITPAHDFNDYEVGLRHQLEIINILNPNATLLLPGTAYDGLDRYQARKQVVADLKAQDLLELVEEHKMVIPRGDRSGSAIEPYLTDQWYVKAGPLAAAATAAVEDGRITFVPENWSRTYYEWMNNIQDWCISRQIWWGHRIPAWYDNNGKVYVGRTEPEVREKYGLGEQLLRQDADVLDTWFSSALWPFSTLGWPEQTAAYKTFYPTSVLITGFDIIFFWVARMVMMGLQFTDTIPFHEVYIHGLVRDAHGQKMSKSKGNILDPIDLIDGVDLETLVSKRIGNLMQTHMAEQIEQTTRREFPDGIPAYGTDALRFTFAALASRGRDINFDMGRITGYRNFCNKLWNASRFVLMNVSSENSTTALAMAGEGTLKYSTAELWIISRLQEVELQSAQALDEYRFDIMAATLYHFVWDEYCSWYLELAKVTLHQGNATVATLAGTRLTLIRVLETLLRLLHPVMPFITEEIWQKVAPLAGRDGETIMLAPYPVADPERINPQAQSEILWLQQLIAGVRNIRGEMNIAPRKPLPLLFQPGDELDEERLLRNRIQISQLACAKSQQLLGAHENPPPSATSLAGAMKIFIPMGSFIDKEAETLRLRRELERLQKQAQRCHNKLANPQFIERAPAVVVAKERQQLAELEAALSKLQEQYDRVSAWEAVRE